MRFCTFAIVVLMTLLMNNCNDETNPTGPGEKDTTYVFRIDTVYSFDTTFTRDSIFSIDTVFSFDTTYTKDTTYIFSLDTVYRFDTTHVNDSVFMIDTVFSFDTTYSRDTVFVFDTVYSFDTTFSKDTVFAFDTVFHVDTIVVNEESWAEVMDSIADISYMIAVRFENTGELSLIGSGFAIADNTILTNAHVYVGLLSAYILYKQNGFDVVPVAVRNGQSSTSAYALPLDTGGYHSEYEDTTNFTHDIGFFKTSSTMPRWIGLASKAEIQSIRVGQEIGTLGYPGETRDRIARIAYATFKDGVISALSPFNSAESPTKENSLIVQHNLNTTGGTSGSPIFDILGNLVAINNSSKKEAIWDDATGSFKLIPTGSVAWGIRADDYWTMLENTSYNFERISDYKIPDKYYYYPDNKICLSDLTKPVYLGTTVATARAAANSLFGKTAPDQTLSDGSLWYSDWNYQVKIIKESGIDNVWSIWIGAHESNIYVPSFTNFWGVTIGTSRSYILNTYGYNYTNSFSADSSYYYYNYSSLGIGFGFDRESQDDWNCDGIQIAESGGLPKRAVGTTDSRFPDIGISERPGQSPTSAGTRKLPIRVKKVFR